MSKYDLIIFDCDGTLVDSEYFYNSCTVDILREYGLDYDIEYAFENWIGHSFDNIIRVEAKKTGADLPLDEILAKFISFTPAYQEKYQKIIPGAVEAVETLSRDFKCCVASNGERPNIISSLRLAGMSEFFGDAQVFSKDEVVNAKPFPDLFLHACKNMDSAPDRTIVIEDSVNGIKAAKAAQMYVIGFNGVGHGELQSAQRLTESSADIVFSDWKDILLHIRSL